MNTNGLPTYNADLYKRPSHWFTHWIAKNKACNLVYGSGFILVSDNEEIQKFLIDFARYNDLQQFLYKVEYDISRYGRKAIWWEPPTQYAKNKAFYKLHTNNPIFPYYAETSGEKTTKLWVVESRKRINLGQKPFMRMMRLSMEEIAFGDPFSAGSSAVLPNPSISRFIKTKNQPFIDIFNLPLYNEFFLSINFMNPDTIRISDADFNKLDEALEYIQRDLATSENRLILTDDMKPNTTDNKERDKIRKSTIIIKNSAAAILGGIDVKAEFIKASPNSETLWKNFDNQFNFLLEKTGYSYDKGAQGSTATENHYSKGNDIQLTAVKRRMREESINELIGNILQEAGLWDGENKKPFIFKINDHFLIDKEKNFQLLTAQTQLGVKTIQDIIVETQNKTPKEAEEQINKVLAERKKYPELFGNESKEIAQNGKVSDKSSNATNPSTNTQEQQKGAMNQYSK